MSSLPRLRTVQQCIEMIKTIDNESAISEWFIRQLCKTDKIMYISNGNKSLVNFDSLLEYLNGPLSGEIIDEE